MKILTALAIGLGLATAPASGRATQVQVPLGAHVPPEGMELHTLSRSGPTGERVNLAFFADGYTSAERDKFLAEARRLTADILAGGPMDHVADLLNVFGVFVPSSSSGLGQDGPLPGAPFGLYREGPELRGVYPAHEGAARAACAFWRESKLGGCDQAILLGNDGLYGGLGGEFTIITASELNGPLVLRHELGHSLIPVGEEYDGGYFYEGVNAEIVENLHNLSWAAHLSDPGTLRIEDLKVPLQAYPWHDLDDNDYEVDFTPTGGVYPSALLRLSLSSIPAASHIDVSIGGAPVDISASFPPEWEGSLDRRWIEVPLSRGLMAVAGLHLDQDQDHVRPLKLTFAARLTAKGKKATPGKGGKMISSVEVIEYGEKCNTTPGFIGAFPTYSENGTVTLRPMNEECIMRRVTHRTFCPVCAQQLRRSLEDKIARKRRRSQDS